MSRWMIARCTTQTIRSHQVRKSHAGDRSQKPAAATDGWGSLNISCEPEAAVVQYFPDRYRSLAMCERYYPEAGADHPSDCPDSKPENSRSVPVSAT